MVDEQDIKVAEKVIRRIISGDEFALSPDDVQTLRKAADILHECWCC